MNLVPVPESRLDDLLPILQRRVAELETPVPADAEVYLEYVKAGYGRRLVAAYVDSLDEPHRVLVVSHFPDTWTRAVMCSISLMFVDKELRGSLSDVKTFLSTSEAYARLHGAKFVIGGAFFLAESRRLGSVWKRYGYEEINTNYYKVLS